MTLLAKMLTAWMVRRYWGRRCDTVNPGCANCAAWLMHDYLFGKAWWDGETREVQITIHVPISVVMEVEE